MNSTLSLRRVMALAIAVGLLLPILFSSWQTYRQQQAILAAALENDQQRLAGMLANGLAGMIWDMDKTAIKMLEEACVLDERVVRISLNTGHEHLPGIERPERRQGQLLTVTKPMVWQGHDVGEVRLDMDTGQMDQRLRQQFQQFLLIAAAQLALSLTLILLILNARFVVPIRRLMVESALLACRNLDQPFMWQRRDELGALGNSLESTRLSLHAAFKELQESEQRFRSLTQLSSDWYWERDAEDRLTLLSPEFIESTGIDPADFFGGKRGTEAGFSYDPDDWQRYLQSVATREPFHDLQWKLNQHNGQVHYGNISGEPIFEQNGAFRGYRGVGKDVTAAKLAEAAQKSEVRLRKLVEHLPAGAIYIDAGTILLNKAAESLTGYTREEIAGVDDWFSKIFGATASQEGEHYVRDRALGFPEPREIEIRRKDGSMRTIEFAGYLDESSEVWLLHDVTLRQATQEALEEILMEQRAILNNAIVGIYFLKGPFLQRCNRSLEEMLGYGFGELVGRPLAIIFEDTDSSARFIQASAPLIASGRSWVGEWQAKRRDGALLWVQFHGKVIDPDDVGRGSIWVTQDISERRHAEEALKRSLMEQQAMFDNAIAGIELVRNRVIERCNRGLEVMLGYESGELVGKPTRIYYASAQSWLDHCNSVYPLLKAGLPASGEWEMVRKDGRRIWCIYHGKPLDPHDISKGSIWVMQDISERKDAEASLQQAMLEQQALLDHSLFGIAFVVDRKIVRNNSGMEQILGYAPGELTGKSTRYWYMSEQDFHDMGEAAAALHGADSYARDMPFRRKDGSSVWCSFNAKWIEPDRPDSGSICVMQDISARKATEEALKRAMVELEKTLARVRQSESDMLLRSELSGFLQACETQHEAFRSVASFMPRLFPGSAGTIYLIDESAQELVGQANWGRSQGSVTSFLPSDCWAMRRGLPYQVHDPQHQSCCSHLSEERGHFGTYICLPLAAQGDIFALLFIDYHIALADPDKRRLRKRRAIALAEQIGLALANLRLREKLRAQSMRDPLTGLYNRRYMHDVLRRELIRARRSGGSLAVAVADVDFFKNFNDTYGHDAGDVVLQSVARALEDRVRENDLVCRFGGEEFVVVLPDISAEMALKRLNGLLAAIRELNLKHGGRDLGAVTASFGVALYPGHGIDTERLLKRADEALYKAKKTGRNRVVMCDADELET